MEIVRADSPQQLLLAIPHLAGARIARSIVLVPFHGSRSGMPSRVDLPVRLPAAARGEWARSVLEPIAAVRADAVAIVVVTDATIGAGGLPHRAIVRALRQRARSMGVPVRACLCQGADAWGDYSRPASAQGPLAELEVAGGMAFVEPLQPPSLPEPASVEQRRAVASCIAELDRAHDAYVERVREGVDVRLDDVPRLTLAGLDAPILLESSLHQTVVGLELAALLIRVLQAPPMRDVATSQWLDGFAAGARAHDDAAAFALDSTMPADREADRLMGKGPAPDPVRLERAIGLMERLVALAPEPMRPALLTILASLHWYLGRAGTGERCVREALRIEPGYGMARLVAQMLEAGWLPDWVEASRHEHAMTRAPG